VHRSALIVGGSGGIGLAIAVVLAEEGLQLTLVGRRPERLEAAAKTLRPNKCRLSVGDVTDTDAPSRIVNDHMEQFGRLDVLVNCAGTGHFALAGDIEEPRYRKQLTTNFMGTVAMTNAAINALHTSATASRPSLIVNMSSIAAKAPIAGQSIYSATKAALTAWSNAMRPELRRLGISTVVLHPDLVETRMTAWLADSIDPRTMLRTRDIAEAVRLVLRLGPRCDIPEISFLRRSP
jgi:short-subunit dehydrogenase